MNEHSGYLHQFSCTKVTNGATRSTILDLERNKFHLVPNDLINFLKSSKGKTFDEIQETYPLRERETVMEYIDFLIGNHIIFFSNLSPERFPEIDNNWDSFSTISNCVVDVMEPCSNNHFGVLIDNINNLNCQYVELRFFFSLDVKEVLTYLKMFHESVVRGIIITLPFGLANQVELESLLDDIPRLLHINLYGVGITKEETELPISFIESSDPRLACGMISSKGFAINIENYTESQRYNSCLNRKLNITLPSGELKNCGSMKESFGSLFDQKLVDIVNSKEFQKLWTITKSQIDDCKICEFREVCSDCRAFTDNDDITKSKPLKCGYNPTTGEWSDWEKFEEKKTRFKKISELIL